MVQAGAPSLVVPLAGVPFLVEVPSPVEVPSKAEVGRRIAAAAPSKAAVDRRIAAVAPSKAAVGRRIAAVAPSKMVPYQVARRSFAVVGQVLASMHAFLLASLASLLLPFVVVRLLQLEFAVPRPCAILACIFGIEIFSRISAGHMKEPATCHRLPRSECRRTPDTFSVENSLQEPSTLALS